MTRISQTRDEAITIYLKWLTTENFSFQILMKHLKLSLSIYQSFFLSVYLFFVKFSHLYRTCEKNSILVKVHVIFKTIYYYC